MSAPLKIEVTGATAASPAEVWTLLDDVARFAKWGPWDEAGYDRPGDHEPHGVGAIQHLRLGRTTTIEQIVEVEPQRCLRYRVLSGIPVKDYVGNIELTPADGGGTSVHWWSTFRPTLLGRIVRPRLQRVFDEAITDLCAHADAITVRGSRAD